jgi:hypothetical protein
MNQSERQRVKLISLPILRSIGNTDGQVNLLFIYLFILEKVKRVGYEAFPFSFCPFTIL